MLCLVAVPAHLSIEWRRHQRPLPVSVAYLSWIQVPGCIFISCWHLTGLFCFYFFLFSFVDRCRPDYQLLICFVVFFIDFSFGAQVPSHRADCTVCSNQLPSRVTQPLSAFVQCYSGHSGLICCQSFYSLLVVSPGTRPIIKINLFAYLLINL